jgi:hypothetical protein
MYSDRGGAGGGADGDSGKRLFSFEVMMRGRWKWAAALLGPLAVVSLAGCSGGDQIDRYPIEGKVTFQGQPLEHGTVQFQPQDNENGIQSGAQIKQGEFKIPEAQGLPPGSYRVMLFSADSAQEAAPTDAPPGDSNVPVAKEKIPPAYNSKSTLVVDVKEDVDNKFEFTIQ